MQSDPIGLMGGINTFAYVGNEPLQGFDPFGLARCTCSATSSQRPTNARKVRGIIVKVCKYDCGCTFKQCDEDVDVQIRDFTYEHEGDSAICYGQTNPTRATVNFASFSFLPNYLGDRLSFLTPSRDFMDTLMAKMREKAKEKKPCCQK